MMVSADTVFARFNHIFEMLDQAMDLVQHTDTTPFNVEQGALLDRKNTSQKCEAVPRRAREAHRLVYHSTLGLRVIKKRKREEEDT